MAQPLETHYDHLQVMRTAPLEVIKASYRVLSQKYHPDRNPDPEALRIMKRVNQAWDVLSDPERRARHDRWIEDSERKAEPEPPLKAATAAQPTPRKTGQSVDAGLGLDLDLKKYVLRLPLLIGVSLALLIGAVQLYRWINAPADESSANEVSRAFGLAEGARYVQGSQLVARPSERLPHGYIKSEPQDPVAGTAAIDIDNIVGYKDAEVRLYLNGRRVRSLFVQQGQDFSVTGLAPGSYILKYRFAVFDAVQAYQVSEIFDLKNDAKVPRVTLFSRTEGMLPGQQIAPDQF
ncbi:MAG: J domain-containing protein [Pseudomonadota bacterium]